ncbi:MAG: rubredoxin [Candidatus Magnetoovum sp. WYHC-5]|nr:rubredoxin [Candidatus Magnetoovum sp. WYHC-5]
MYRCTVCGWIYDENKEGKPFSEVGDDFTCPICNAPKEAFEEA